MEKNSVYSVLSKVDLRDKAEKKNTGSTTLTYLSWPIAWAAVVERYPDANYRLVTFGEEERLFTYDENTGYMVHTEVTIDGITRRMWLPVMDSHNAAMKNKPYEVKTKYSTYTVPAASMTDINKAIMRCLVKNLAMFGLGLNFFAGEDNLLSSVGNDTEFVTNDNVAEIRQLMQEMGWKNEGSVAKYFNVSSIDKMTASDLETFRGLVQKEKASKKGVKDMDAPDTSDTDPKLPDK